MKKNPTIQTVVGIAAALLFGGVALWLIGPRENYDNRLYYAGMLVLAGIGSLVSYGTVLWLSSENPGDIAAEWRRMQLVGKYMQIEARIQGFGTTNRLLKSGIKELPAIVKHAQDALGDLKDKPDEALLNEFLELCITFGDAFTKYVGMVKKTISMDEGDRAELIQAFEDGLPGNVNKFKDIAERADAAEVANAKYLFAYLKNLTSK